MAVRKLIFGCGYLGQRVARLWQAAGDEVWVVTRRPDAAAAASTDTAQPQEASQ